MISKPQRPMRKYTVKEVVRETAKMSANLFRRVHITAPELKPPAHLTKLYFKNACVKLLRRNVISNLMSCIMLLANFCILHDHPILGIAFFMLYQGRDILLSFLFHYEDIISNELTYLCTNHISVIGNTILGKVCNHIYVPNDTYFRQASKEEISNALTTYINGAWKINADLPFTILSVIITCVMLGVNILANQTIPTALFATILVISSLLYFYTVASQSLHFSDFIENKHANRDNRSTILNDLLRVVSIIPYDFEIRIQRLKNVTGQNYENEKSMQKTKFFSSSIRTILSIVSIYVIIIFSLVNTPGNIELGTITTLIATISVFQATLDNINSIMNTMQGKTEAMQEVKSEEALVKEIMRVFQNIQEVSPHPIEKLEVDPFSIRYSEHSENDRPFMLKLTHKLVIKMGEIIALTGPSGSGKSTLLKLLLGIITFVYDKGNSIPRTNYMFYDETTTLGSFPIWDELFCLDEIVHPQPSEEDLFKMEYLFKNLFLWQEISEQCKDVWQWCKEHQFKALSNGQKQRLFIAKILFWMNSDIDIIALDEPTSGLDASDANNQNNADAEKIFRFIINYCNHDRKRIILISTHQVEISNLCTRKLYFHKENGVTTIQ